MHEGRTNGWDIRLQCVICGFRTRANRYEGNPPLGHEPPPTVERDCSNCHAEANHPIDGVRTLHFVDIATDAEISEQRYEGYNQRPICEF
jgi:hypothetical protein